MKREFDSRSRQGPVKHVGRFNAREGLRAVGIGLLFVVSVAGGGGVGHAQDALDERARRAETLESLGMSAQARGQNSPAIEYLDQALAIRRELGDRRGQAKLLDDIALSYRALGQPAPAIKRYEEAWEIRRMLGDDSAVGTTLENIGAALKESGHNARTVEYYKLASTVWGRLGANREVARTYAKMGGTLYELGRYKEAADFSSSAGILHEDVGDRTNAAISWNIAGAANIGLKRNYEALDSYRRAASLSRQAGEHSQLAMQYAISTAGRAAAFFNLGYEADALSFSLKAADLAPRGDPLKEFAVTLANRAAEELPQSPAVVWNAWVTKNDLPVFDPVTEMTPGNERDGDARYQLVVDLSAIPYSDDAQAVKVRKASPKWRDELAAACGARVAPDSRLLLFVDTASVTVERAWAPLRLDLPKLCAWQKRPEAPASLSSSPPTPDAPFVFGRANFSISPQRAGDIGASVWLWVDGRPIEEVASLRLCIVEPGAKACGAHKTVEWGLTGVDLFGASVSGMERPDAALHLIDVPEVGLVGVFNDRSAPDEFSTWRLPLNATDFLVRMEQLRRNFAEAKTEEARKQFGSDLYATLFRDDTSDGRAAKRRFSDFLKPTIAGSAAGRARRPSIFVRMLQLGRESPPMIPLGMMFVETADRVGSEGGRDGDHLGFKVAVETALQSMNFSAQPGCLDRWILVVPPEGFPEEPLRTARAKVEQGWLKQWSEKSKGFMKPPVTEPFEAFARWIGDASAKPDDATAVMVLSHQDGGSVYFSKSRKLTPERMRRKFARPSVAVMNGCSTAEPSSDIVVSYMNRIGFMSIVATATPVDPAMAGHFMNCFAAAVAGKKGGPGEGIGPAFADAIECLRAQKDAVKAPYGARALEYVLMGNGYVGLCEPKP